MAAIYRERVSGSIRLEVAVVQCNAKRRVPAKTGTRRFKYALRSAGEPRRFAGNRAALPFSLKFYRTVGA